MEEKRFRNQVTWMMFILSILVIWVHSYNAELFAGGQWGPAWDHAVKIENFMSVGLSQIAVPGFFMVSSYLFFRNFELKKLPDKWKGRFFSVAVPYVAWTFLYYLGYVAAAKLPMVLHVVGREPIPFTIEEMVHAIMEYRYAPIFWYLYQLIFLILLSPMVYGAVKNKVIGIGYLLMLLAAIHFHLDTAHPNTDALFYYSAAAYAAVHGKKWTESRGTPDRAAASMMVLAASIFCYGTMKNEGADVLWTVLYRLLMPVFLWMVLSCLQLPAAKPWMRQSMFLYGIHFIVVRFVNKGAALLLAQFAPENVRCIMATAVYFVLPAITVAVSYFMARILMRWVPVLWWILSGGRKLED